MSALFDDPILGMWFALFVGFMALALYSTLLWLEVRGIRGLAMATLATSVGLLTLLLAWMRVGSGAWLPVELLRIGVRVVFPAMFLSMFVLVDLWSADMNGHRSITTKVYTAWKKLAGSERKPADRLKEAQ